MRRNARGRNAAKRESRSVWFAGGEDRAERRAYLAIQLCSVTGPHLEPAKMVDGNWTRRGRVDAKRMVYFYV
jgi:hypothetical protein